MLFISYPVWSSINSVFTSQFLFSFQKRHIMLQKEIALIAIIAICILTGTLSESMPRETPSQKRETGYKFQYLVMDDTTGDYKKQEEAKNGNDVYGKYSLAQPDGKVRTVRYRAGPGRGFEAEVDFQPEDFPERQTRSRYVMNMMDPKRHPKPKPPVGNDLGVAHVLASNVKVRPDGYSMDNSGEESNVEKLKFDVVQTHFPLRNESISDERIDEEIKMLEEAIPSVPEIHLSNFKVEEDPEEKAINDRITMVARQLAEAEDHKTKGRQPLVGNILPISVGAQRHTEGVAGKSLEYPTLQLPLASERPQENGHLQLISEVPRLLQIMTREGFRTVPLSPEMSGPLLGGPLVPYAGKPASSNNARNGRTVVSPSIFTFIPLDAYLLKQSEKPYGIVLNMPIN